MERDAERRSLPPSIARLPTPVQAVFRTPERFCELARFGSAGVEGTLLHDSYETASSGEFLELLTAVVAVVGDDSLPQNYRDAALGAGEALLRTYGLEMDKIKLLDTYIRTIKKLDGNEDYFGAPLSLHQWGELLSSTLGPATDYAQTYLKRMQLRAAWSAYVSRIADRESRTTAAKLSDELVEKLLPPIESQAPLGVTWQWSRASPELMPPDQALHDFCLTELRSHPSLKQFVYENSTQWQASFAGTGSELADFWNLHDTEAALTIIEAFADQSFVSLVPLRTEFDRALRQMCGISLADLHRQPELAKAMADNIIGAQTAVQLRLMNAVTQPPGELLQRLRQQIDESATARKPARKLWPVVRFLREYGIDGGQTQAELQAYFAEPANIEHLQELIRLRNDDKLNVLSVLQALRGVNPAPNLRLMHRNERDMYSGDQTRDCTAYHLVNGFNAWTMPYWLLNPGFVMCYIDDGSTEIAKAGLLLATDGSGPRIMIDSLEVYETAPEGFETIYAIHKGLRQIHAWAERRGYGPVFFCDYTHSQGLIAGLPVVSNPSPPAELTMFGGGRGINEVTASVLGGTNDNPAFWKNGYYQSLADGEEDEDGEDEDGNTASDRRHERNDTLNSFERFVRRASSERVFQVAAKGRWPAFFEAYIADVAPTLHTLFGRHNALYRSASEERQRTFSQAVEFQLGLIKIVDRALQGALPRAKIEAELDRLASDLTPKDPIEDIVKDISILAQAEGMVRLRHEADRLDGLLRVVARMKRQGITKKAALAFLMRAAGPTEVKKEDDKISLRRSFGIIDGHFYAKRV